MNILFTCAGRRNYLLKYFKESTEFSGNIYCTDASVYAPATTESDGFFLVPPVDSPDYIPSLIKLVDAYSIRAIISLNDLELPILASSKKALREIGCEVIVSSPEVIDISFDKWKTVNFINKIGLLSPRTYLSLSEANEAISKGELAFPLVVKPRWGTASIGMEFPENQEELAVSYQLVKEKIEKSIIAKTSNQDIENAILIQETLRGNEYGLDIINDLDGNYVTTIVKQKLAMRAGETDKAITRDISQIKQLGKKIGQQLRHVGNLDCDVFWDNSSTPYVLELNPRFGGGYPFSQHAGADIPSAIVCWLNGTKAPESYFEVDADIASAKCDYLVTVGNKPLKSYI